MVINDQYRMTAEDIRQQRKDAMFAEVEAREELSRLVLEMKVIGKRAAKIAALAQTVEDAPERPLHSEADLLMLTPDAFKGLDFETVRALANSIAGTRKEVIDTAAATAILGRRA